jgi:hypothetical protein
MSTDPMLPPTPPVPPGAQPAKRSHLLFKLLAVVVAIFVLKAMFSSKSTASSAGTAGADATAQTSADSTDGDPLVGTWTMVPPGDASCDDKAVFSHNAQGLRLYHGVTKGVAGAATGYAVQGSSVTIGDQNPYGFNSFKITSPTEITKTWCSSMACSSCAYTKD